MLSSNNGANATGQAGKVTAPPGSFSLISPATGSIGISQTPTLTWALSSNAKTYDVYVSTTPTFGAPIATGLIPARKATSVSYTIPSGQLSGGVLYYWMVKAVNSAGSIQSNSIFTFTTATAGGTSDTTPPVVTASHSPATPTSTQQVTYTVTATDTSGVASTQLYIDGTLANSCASATCSYTIGPYTAGSTHSYYGRATDASSNANQGQSATNSFTIAQTGGPVTVQTLDSVKFVSATNAVAVGAGGAVLTSSDTGNSWKLQSALSGDLRGLTFIDANNGWVVGVAGSSSIIYRTNNGGVTWNTIGSYGAILNNMKFVDSNHGIAVGNAGVIVTSNDGGASWTTQTSGTTSYLEGLSYTDVATAYAFGQFGAILKTTNGGASWTTQTSGTQYRIRRSSFISSTVGTAAGYGGTIKRTVDGGASWTTQTSPYGAVDLYDVNFVDANNGWIVGPGGLIIHTANGGSAWTTQTSPNAYGLYGVNFKDLNTGLAVGGQGMIVRTTNGGATWTDVSTNAAP
jgi:photosystem II stability/assembly factor-like uncharacterized protein